MKSDHDNESRARVGAAPAELFRSLQGASESPMDETTTLGGVTALIPARGGSKGIPGKNLRMLAGKPLIGWTVECALAYSGFDRVIVSTDDAITAGVAKDFGAEVPFLRPPELARDDTPDLPVLRHALDWLVNVDGEAPGAVVWLRPTAPLRTETDIRDALGMLASEDFDCVRSICPAEHHPYWMKVIGDDGLESYDAQRDEASNPRRQSLPPVYRLNGAVDIVRPDRLREGGPMFVGRMGGYVMPQDRSVDIDTELDLTVAELLLRRRTGEPLVSDR